MGTADGGLTCRPEGTGLSAGVWLSGVAAGDARHAWAVGEGGAIVATADGGATWDVQDSGVTVDLEGVAAADARHAWAVGERGTVLATADGGRTGAVQASTGSDYRTTLYGVAFVDAQYGWVAGARTTAASARALIYATADGGTTWSRQPAGSVDAICSSAAAVDSSRAWILATDRILLTTTDGGASWAHRVAAGSPDDELNGVAFADAHDGWLVGAKTTTGGESRFWMLATGDGGRSWVTQDLRGHGMLNAVCALPAGR
jgi:photosystem II stability/assembly factor-like uncharacterized protein